MSESMGDGEGVIVGVFGGTVRVRRPAIQKHWMSPAIIDGQWFWSTSEAATAIGAAVSTVSGAIRERRPINGVLQCRTPTLQETMALLPKAELEESAQEVLRPR